MTDNPTGPAIFVKKGIINTQYLMILDKLIEQRQIKPSLKLFVTGFNNASVNSEYQTNDGYFIRYFSACDLISGKIDPDYKKERKIQLSANVTRYKKLKLLTDAGILSIYNNQSIKDKFYPNDLGKPITIYQLDVPDLLVEGQEPHHSNTELSQRSSEYRQARREEKLKKLDMDFGYYAKPLEQLGSMDILATYFNDCIRPSPNVSPRSITKEKRVRNPETNKLGTLSIETTTSSAETAEIMLADDIILLNYFYSSINEQLLSNFDELQTPFQNLFRFDKRSLLLDLKLSDSGGNRETLDKSVDRIINTRFSLSSDSEALWLMQKLGLVDGNGKPYSKAPVRLIEEVGQTEDSTSEDLDALFKARGSLRYFDLALPSFLERQINDTIKNRREKMASTSNRKVPVLKMFTRDKKLLSGEEKGLIWLINEHLSSKLARPGFSVGPVPLEKFFSAFSASVKSPDDVMNVLKGVFHGLHSDRHLLYIDGWNVNRRNQPRLKTLHAIIDSKLLVSIDNVTRNYTPTTRIRNLRYTFRAIRLTEDEVKECEERNTLVKQNIQYAEDVVFKSFTDSVFARSGITANKYK